MTVDPAIVDRIRDLCDQADEKRRMARRHLDQFDALYAEAERLMVEAATLANGVLPEGIVPKGDGW